MPPFCGRALEKNIFGAWFDQLMQILVLMISIYPLQLVTCTLRPGLVTFKNRQNQSPGVPEVYENKSLMFQRQGIWIEITRVVINFT